MKNIKNQIAVAVLIIASSVLLYSCNTGNFLSNPATGAVSQQTLSNEKGAQALLVGAYGMLDGEESATPWAVSPDLWIWGALGGGMAHKGSESGDQPGLVPVVDMTITPSNGFLNDFWKAQYEGISRCNAVLKTLKTTKKLSDAKKTEIEAEARFLRGHYYFYLTKMFGKVPWIDQNTTDYKQKRTNVWPHIVKDFTFAYNNLPAVQSKAGKANKWAAAAYLGKAYLFQQDWQNAKKILDKTMANGATATGKPYHLVHHFEDNFRASTETNSETVFAVQFTGPDGTGGIWNSRRGDMLNYPYGGPTTCCGFFNPSQDLVNSFKTNSNGLPMPDSYNQGKMVTSDKGVSSSSHFTPYQGTLDPRLDWTVGRRGMPFHDYGPDPGQEWTRNNVYDSPYWGLKHMFWKATASKYENTNSWAPGSAVNYDIIRYDGVILMAAEADANLGDLDQARQLVNKIRSRIANESYGDGWVSYKLNKPYALATVGSQSAMTSLDASAGDWVIRTDKKATYQLLKSPASNANNWQEYKNANYKIGTYPSGSKWFANKQNAIQAVHFERKLELALEGHRFFDLARWGEAQQKLNAYYQYEGNKLGYPFQKGAHFAKYHDLYPIPQRQIDITSKNGQATLSQNPGYKQ